MMIDTSESIIESDKLYWTPFLDDKNIMYWKSFLPFSFLLISAAHAQWAEKSDNPFLKSNPNPSFNYSTEANKRTNDPFSKKNEPKMYFKTAEDESDIYQINNVSPCLKSIDHSLGNEAFLNLYSFSNSTSNLFCLESITYDKNAYSKDYCDNVSSCAGTKLKEIPMGAEVGLHIQQVLSEDYIQTELKANLVDMVKFENLMKFMAKKYPNDTLVCDSRFADLDHDKACIGSINKNFKEMQKGCMLPQEFCYTNSSNVHVGFSEFEEKNRGTYTNAFSLFFSQRTDKQVEIKSEEDDESTTELLKILAGKGSDKAKEEKFYAALLAPSSSVKYDPITSFLLTNSQYQNHKDEYKKRFDSFVKAALKENKSLAMLKKDFQHYRKELGFSLINEHCKSIPTYDSICVNSEIIYAGTNERKVKADKAQTIIKRNEDYSRLKSAKIDSIISLFPKEEEENILKILSKKEVARILLENARCNTFEFNAPKKHSLLDGMTNPNSDFDYKTMLVTNPELIKMTRLAEGADSVDSTTRKRIARERREEFREKLERETEEKFRKRFVNDRDKADELMTSKLVESALLRRKIEMSEAPKDAPRDLHALDTRKSESLEKFSRADLREDSYSGTDSRLSQQDFSKFASPNIQQLPVIPSTPQNIVVPQDKVTVDSTANTVANTVASKVEPIKTPAKVAVGPVKENKVVEKIYEESSSLDELKQLRSELSSLKTTMKQNEIKANLAQQKGQEEAKTFVPSGFQNTKDARSEEESTHTFSSSKSEPGNKNSSGNSSSSTSSSSQASSRSSDSSPDRSPSPTHARSEALRLTAGSSSGSRGNDKYALVLNTQETTIEQNEQAIVDSILVNNGKTFEIMMDGVPVKVVPVVEKGKLVFEKGKPKYKIFAKDEKVAKDAKTVGDLKIQQEADVKKAADRAQYIKLKELTTSALKDK